MAQGTSTYQRVKAILDVWTEVEINKVAQIVKTLPAVWETWVQSLGQEEPLEKGMGTPVFCLENSMNGGAWPATVYGVTKSWT